MIIILSGFLVSSCATTKPRTAGSANSRSLPETIDKDTDSRPGWIRNKPQYTTDYVGIGSSRTYVPDYRRIAKEKALEDLATAIKVSISSSSFLYQKEVDDGYHEQYQSLISTSVVEQLEDYELHQEWTGNHEYWVCYILSKASYAKNKSLKKTNALNIATDYFHRAKNAEDSGNFASSIKSYLEVIETLKNYLHEPIEINYNGKSILLTNESISSIQSIFDDIHLKQKELALKSKALATPHKIEVQCKSVPLTSFPFILAHGRHETKLISDYQGAISIPNQALITNDQIDLRINRQSILSGIEDKSLQAIIDNSLHYPRLTAQIIKPQIKIHVIGKESNLGSDLLQQQLKPQIINLLSAHSFVFQKASDEQTDFKLIYTAQTRKGSETQGLFVSFLDLKVELFDNQRQLIYSNQMVESKGISISFEKAGFNAYTRIKPSLEERIVDPLIEFIF